LDVSKVLKKFKEVQTPNGTLVKIGIDYERIRKRCFHCQRLTHDKLRCPFISPLDSNVLFEEISAPADIPSKDKKEESLPQHCTTLPPGLPKLMADAIKVYTPHPSVSALVTISSDVSSGFSQCILPFVFSSGCCTAISSGLKIGNLVPCKNQDRDL